MQGVIPAGGMSPRLFRVVIWGPLKSGKTVFCATWPAPLFVHSFVESGYDTFMLPDGRLLFPTIPVGVAHTSWVETRQGKRVSEELSSMALDLFSACRAGKPYQTLVLGGFSDLLSLVKQEADTLFTDGQKAWGYLSDWASRFLTVIFSLPIHVIVEVASATKRKNRSGSVIALKPDISGKSFNLLLNKANLILFQEALGQGIYQTHFSRVMRADTEEKSNGILEYAFATSRILGLSFTQPVRNCSYDNLAQAIGLPGVQKLDSNHPRCVTGLWPWPHPHA